MSEVTLRPFSVRKSEGLGGRFRQDHQSPGFEDSRATPAAVWAVPGSAFSGEAVAGPTPGLLVTDLPASAPAGFV